MRVTDSFRDFVLDQLSGVRHVRARAMFGGIGLYMDDIFFGILAADVLYFKVGETNRPDYAAAGSRPFKPYADRSMTMPYYNVPIGVLEDAGTLVSWARRSVDVAKASRKTPSGSRRAPRRRG
jgi:DNA transformation protein and related proteins